MRKNNHSALGARTFWGVLCQSGKLLSALFGNWSLLVLLLWVSGVSCTKKDAVPPGAATLTLVNAVADSRPLVTNFQGTERLPSYVVAYRIAFGIYRETDKFTFYSGDFNLQLYQYPDTTVHDTPLFDLKLNLPVGDIKTLFLTGTVSHPDTLYVTDHPPFHETSDSVVGIRFVNLLPGSAPVSVNLQGKPNGSSVEHLSFKDITGFIPFATLFSTGIYVFEFRDVASGALITTYTTPKVGAPGIPSLPSKWIFRNKTMALIGTPGGTGANVPKVMLINNY